MQATEVLADAFGRTRENVHGALDGLDVDQLAARLDEDANSIGWLVWHLTRVQDDHVADVAGLEQVYTAQGFAPRWDLPLPAEDTGYGHTSDQIAQVVVPADQLIAYHDAVHAQTVRYLDGVGDDELDRVIDENWDPPVTLGVRLVSVADDAAQHAGQAAFARGILLRR